MRANFADVRVDSSVRPGKQGSLSPNRMAAPNSRHLNKSLLLGAL